MEIELVADKTIVEFNHIFLVRTHEKRVWEELDNREKYITECGANFSPLREIIEKTETFDLNVVRMCVQVLLRRHDGLLCPLAPLLSDPILDFQAFSDINILEMCPNEGNITGGTKIMLLIKRFKDIHEQCKKHIETQFHKEALKAPKSFLEGVPVDLQLNKYSQRIIDENRKIIKSIISCITFCGLHDLALRGKHYGEGILEDLYRLRIDAGDLILKKHIEQGKKNASYRLVDIQNEIIGICESVIKADIMKIVKEAAAYSVLADETADISGTEQLTPQLKKSDNASIFFVDEEKKTELPARMAQEQRYVLSNGYGVLVFYSPEFSIEQSMATKSFLIKVKLNNKETRLEDMTRYFRYRRILYLDSVYADETHDKKYLNLIHGKSLYKALIDVHDATYGHTKKEDTKTVHQSIINYETDQFYSKSLRQNEYYDPVMCSNQTNAPFTPFSDNTTQDNSQNYVDSNILSTNTEGYFTAKSNTDYTAILLPSFYHNNDGSFTQHQQPMSETNLPSVQFSYPNIQMNHTQNYGPNKPFYDMESFMHDQDPSKAKCGKSSEKPNQDPMGFTHAQNSTTSQEIQPSHNDMEFDDSEFSFIDSLKF